MKLVYCVPALYNPGGMERVLTEKVNYLVNTGKYDITIVTTDQNHRPVYFLLDDRIQLVDFGLNFEEHFAAGLVKKTWLHYKKLSLYKKKLQEYLVKCKADICISLCGKEIDFLTSLKDGSRKMAEIHFSMNNRKQFIMARHQGFLWSCLGDFRTWQLKRATRGLERLVVLTNQDAVDWQKTHKNVVVISNPIPFNCPEKPNLNSKRVIAIGKLDEQKGYDYLLEAWKLVHARHADWQLDIFGQGPWREKLEACIEENALGDSAFLHGTTTDVKSEYLKSAFYVMSSRYEGLPMVLIEAMACGLPLVSFDCECGPREVIKEGENGFLVPMGNVEKLAGAICRLIEDGKLRERMSVKAKEYASRYSLENIMPKWMNLFNELIEK